ncbi:hypothetical protein Scep_023612 [Stephania cephalantha]|uniref:Uncharacterized protein n=1 Tax=Stephania cephalantha TaxID=152367 RepID=A0AAP0HWF1_9MAGN
MEYPCLESQNLGVETPLKAMSRLNPLSEHPPSVVATHKTSRIPLRLSIRLQLWLPLECFLGHRLKVPTPLQLTHQYWNGNLYISQL